MAQAKVQTAQEKYAWQVLIIVMIGTVMSALDASIVNVSLPAIMADFGSSLDDIEWVITGYMLAFATLMPLTAWMRDRVGHKVLFLGSLLIFTLGSVLCAVAPSMPMLVFARVIQAFGGGAITPTGMAMIADVFPASERGKALGYWGMGVIAGPAIGPTLGGWLTKVFGWRSIFMINLPIGLIGLLMAVAILRADKPSSSAHKPFDVWGFLFLSIFLISFLLGVSKGEHEGWTSTYIVTCMILAALGFVGFLTVELLIPHGVVDLSLFSYPIYTASIAVTVVRSVALYGGTFLLPLFLQLLRGLDEVQSGALMLPGSLAIAVVMPMTNSLNERFGPRTLSLVGLAGIALSMFMYRTIDINTSLWDLIFPTLLRGIGIGMIVTPVMATALNNVPPEKAGAASSMMSLMQQVGGSVGIAVLGTILSHRTTFHMSTFGGNVNADSHAFQKAVQLSTAHAHQLGYTLQQSAHIGAMEVGRFVSTSAQAAGFEDAFLFGAFIVVAGLATAFMMPNRKVTVDPAHMAME